MPERAAKKKAVASKAAKKTVAKRAKKAPARSGAHTKGPARTRAPRPPAPVERAIDHDLVDRTVDLLRDHDDRTLESELAIGAHLLESYYGGDERAARSNDPRKAQSYRLLRERAGAETTWSEAKMRRAVLRVIVYRSLAESVAKQIPATLLYELAKLEDVEKRIALAGAIATGRLAGLAARDAIAEANASERRGGRPAVPAIVKLATRVEREWERAREGGGLTARRLAALDDGARDAVRERLVRLRAELDAVLERLHAR